MPFKNQIQYREYTHSQVPVNSKLPGLGINAGNMRGGYYNNVLSNDASAIESNLYEMKKGKIAVNSEFETSLEGVWSGGDCVGPGEDLTVQAVEDGKQAANSIHQKIMQQ